MTNGCASYSCHPLPLLWALATSAKTFLPSFTTCFRIPLEAAATSIPAHPVSPHPEHQPSMVPKACSVLEEIFTFFSSCSETTVLACPDSHIFDGILLPVFIWNLFFIRTKTRDLPWWFRWILTQVLFITQHCSSPALRLCLTFSFLEVLNYETLIEADSW